MGKSRKREVSQRVNMWGFLGGMKLNY